MPVSIKDVFYGYIDTIFFSLSMAYSLTANFPLTNKNRRPIFKMFESNYSKKLVKYSLSHMGVRANNTGVMSLRLVLRDSGEFFRPYWKGE
jgi:hypothetical protein